MNDESNKLIDPTIARQMANDLWAVAGRAAVAGRWLKVTGQTFMVYLYPDGNLEECAVRPGLAPEYWNGDWDVVTKYEPSTSKMELPDLDFIEFHVEIGAYSTTLHLEGLNELHGTESHAGIEQGAQMWFRLAESEENSENDSQD